ncbi:MAG: hypothetical protein EXS11_01655 [Gemmataceae bacterium]|nr:hypothetical protein [Gemmataceae bacterium]
MNHTTKWNGFLVALFFAALGGCVPSTMPSFLQMDNKPKEPIAKTGPVVPMEGTVAIQPSKIDDANASDMLQNLRKEIDAAGANPRP